MSQGSFYFRDNPAFKGGSPQAVYEELWERGRKQRMIQRGVVAGIAFLVAAYGLTPAWGLLIGAAAGGLTTLWQWWCRAMHSVWLHGRRGERRTANVLRYTLEPFGYRVLHGRSVPGYGNLDQLVIGPTGVWAISSQAWAPDAEFAVYGDRLFVGRDLGAPEIAKLAAAAETVAERMTERRHMLTPAPSTDDDGADLTLPASSVVVQPILTVYGGKMPRNLVFQGVRLARSYNLARVIRDARPKSEHLSGEEIEALTQAAIHALPIGDHTMAAR